MRLTRGITEKILCFKCDNYLWDGQVFNDHIAREHMFQCNKCWHKFVEEDKLEFHFVEMRCELICEECGALFKDRFQLKHHNDKYHASSLEPTAAAVGYKCEDEVDSKASVGKEHTRDSALFDEPTLSFKSNEEILPISVLSVEKEVHKFIIEGAIWYEVPMSIRSVEPSVQEQREEEKTEMIQRVKMRTNQIVKIMRKNIQRKEVLAVKL